VCPITITPQLFLAAFPAILKQRGIDDAVTVSAARVPVVKFMLNDTSVDVVCVSYASATAPAEKDFLPISVFQCISKETRQSVQGFRTVLEIRRRIPVPLDVYSTTLRAIKYWAVQRKVYGNNYCYPAGVSLAVMVARVCQVFPASLPNALVRFFFLFYRQWLGKQTTVSPLFITERLKPDPPPRIHGMWDTWDPQRDACKEDLLPVLNPAYPHNNTCYNVGRSGRDHFYREIVRANAILQQQQAPGIAMTKWDDLWPPYRLGDDYNHFLMIEVAEMNGLSTSEKQGFDSWALLIESKLKILLFSLECWCEVRMWPKRLSSTVRCQKGRAWTVGVRTGGCDPWTYPMEFLSRMAVSVEEFRFAVEEIGLRGANAFPRVVASMPSPVCFLMTSLDAGLPEDVMPTPRNAPTKRGRSDE
jgi:poly(A) polymerase